MQYGETIQNADFLINIVKALIMSNNIQKTYCQYDID